MRNETSHSKQALIHFAFVTTLETWDWWSVIPTTLHQYGISKTLSTQHSYQCWTNLRLNSLKNVSKNFSIRDNYLKAIGWRCDDDQQKSKDSPEPLRHHGTGLFLWSLECLSWELSCHYYLQYAWVPSTQAQSYLWYLQFIYDFTLNIWTRFWPWQVIVECRYTNIRMQIYKYNIYPTKFWTIRNENGRTDLR